MRTEADRRTHDFVGGLIVGVLVRLVDDRCLLILYLAADRFNVSASTR
jgi:hypothetical protein